ncbi:acyl-CoA dehydrogenase family protein [Actinoplanes sp. NPDC049668]|uniref:acyl-CoA dehydrogenase family protein n=1 Tax=unclassified Actinoplanes TaxID=2626549 RepID=UPI0033ADCE26
MTLLSTERPTLAGLDPAMLRLPFFTERHTELAGRVTAWTAANAGLWRRPLPCPPAEHGRTVLRELGDAGLLAFLHPGGPADDGDMRSLCLAREALAYADDLADFAFSIQALSATPILRHGSPAQRERFLPGLADGTLQGAFAVSEPQAGSDLAAAATRATRDGDGFVLDGVKAWIANAGTADVYAVLARTGEGAAALGLSMFLVPADTPGLRVEPADLVAPRAFGHLHLDGVRLGADALLGRSGGGFAIALEVLDRFRMTVGAAAVGFARRAAHSALRHTRTRAIYGSRLGDLGTVRAALADMDVRLNAAGLLVARAAWEADRESRYQRHSAIAKLYATEAAQSVVDDCVQMFGAAGLVADSITERLYRQIRSLRIYEGASEVQRDVIAGSLDLRRAQQCGAIFDVTSES